VINNFRGENFFLSNFYLVNIDCNGLRYPSAEHAFQASKASSGDIKSIFTSSSLTASEAKKLGRRIVLSPNWDKIKLQVMKEILEIKFSIPELETKLINTGSHILQEGNTWGDTFWGVYKGKGKNHLGKILMKIRTKKGEENDLL